MVTTEYLHAVELLRDKCQGCVGCVKVCPTEAIRVRNGKAEILGDRCIDCGACAAKCPYHAFHIQVNPLSVLSKYAYNIVLPPTALYGQFALSVSREDIWQSLINLGFNEIFDVSLAAEYAACELKEYLEQYTGGAKPLISSSCPAVLRLIQVKFPELINQVVPILPPEELAAIYLRKHAPERLHMAPEDIGIWYIAPCPAKEANIRQAVDVENSALTGSIGLGEIYGLVLKNLGGAAMLQVPTGSSYGMSWDFAGGELLAADLPNAFAVHGIENIGELLEQISMNKMPQLDYVECSACQGGCIGGVLAAENKFVAESNLQQRVRLMRGQEGASREETLAVTMKLKDFPCSKDYHKELVARPMMQLDDDIMEAMRKFERMEEVLCALPGLDCGACGAPSCQCLAEDIVQGKAHEIDCIFKLRSSVHKLAQGMADLVKQIPISHEPEPLNTVEDDNDEGK